MSFSKELHSSALSVALNISMIKTCFGCVCVRLSSQYFRFCFNVIFTVVDEGTSLQRCLQKRVTVATSFKDWWSVSVLTHPVKEQKTSVEGVKDKGETCADAQQQKTDESLQGHHLSAHYWAALWIPCFWYSALSLPSGKKPEGAMALYRTEGPFLHNISVSVSSEGGRSEKSFVLEVAGNLAGRPGQSTGQLLLNRCAINTFCLYRCL